MGVAKGNHESEDYCGTKYTSVDQTSVSDNTLPLNHPQDQHDNSSQGNDSQGNDSQGEDNHSQNSIPSFRWQRTESSRELVLGFAKAFESSPSEQRSAYLNKVRRDVCKLISLPNSSNPSDKDLYFGFRRQCEMITRLGGEIL